LNIAIFFSLFTAYRKLKSLFPFKSFKVGWQTMSRPNTLVSISRFFGSLCMNMKHLTFPTLLVTAFLSACSKAPAPTAPVSVPAPVAAKAPGIDWIHSDGNLDAAFARAKTENKPLFLYWGAVWCPPCNQVKATIFNRQDFIEKSKLFVPVYLDGDSKGAQKLGTQYKVRGYPTMILFAPDGKEIMRLPGEVDVQRYVTALTLGMSAGRPVKVTLDAALAKDASLTEKDWAMLSLYSWETDEAALVSKPQLAGTLSKLAAQCPPQFTAAQTRLDLKAMVAAASAIEKDKPVAADAAARARFSATLNEPTLLRENIEALSYSVDSLAALLAAPKTPERAELVRKWDAALEQLAQDNNLSRADRLGALNGRIALAKLDQPKDFKPGAALQEIVRAAAKQADQSTTDKYERQAVIPTAADLLADAGLMDDSNKLLEAELPKAVSPYYHMLGLAANAKNSGNKQAAVDWAGKAYAAAQGPATRIQWGASYVNMLVDQTPQDTARIEKAASQIFGELEPAPETFYERNRRSLERIGKRLIAWNKDGKHKDAVAKLRAQLDAVCAKLPAGDESRTACEGVFNPPAPPGKKA
jgi:thioredoxin-related protein